jgi:hypothetical protein
MSYDIGIYHPTVRKRAEGGAEMDEFDHPPLDAAAVARFIEGLSDYGYESGNSTPAFKEFKKDVDGSPVEVRIFPTEIAFKVSFGKNSKDAIFEALQDAQELLEPDHMCLFDPQSGEWAEI